MQRIISIKHHVDDYECMWNGIEDIYMDQTGECLPENFFFILSSFGSFCYLKTPKSELKRMVALGDGRTKKMYEFLSPIVGFTYHHYEYQEFEKALKKARTEVDAGYPVVLGALDMFYLPYFEKFYQKEHIPFHYVLMAGYDEEQRSIDLYDCGRTELITLSYEELRKAMNCSYFGLSKANTVCTIRMNAGKDKRQIAETALARKKDLFLYPQTSFLGYKGFEKFIKELSNWKSELGKESYDKILANMVMFFGTVPTTPNKIRGIDEPEVVEYKGGFDKMSRMLSCLGQEIGKDDWMQAASVFEEGAFVIKQISDVIIEYLTGKNDRTELLPKLFSEVLKSMTEGYQILEV
ncbi:MAG: BtrH N-terminal domain-containing protein [Lachnospiraceae bacterium]